ncbi:class I SAM-dependent methyltransferase [Lactobacillus sp. Sy-1]|uniref:class I SAM-dependent methyltransferase n=1 Tax=Lactobacillus sp. Sy-1 TaxID=2109645 RepID=UPI001C5BBECC|nr:methyltransferase domain-containing protein [Lactobacillus sp. Sy-1]MBW1606235.1 methyltransferase domain-containing protein [Lactobacillus sp. Sy-1]
MTTNSRKQRRQKHRFSISLNFQLPTPPLVLFVFALVGFYIANDSLLILLLSLGFLVSALFYLNTFWLGFKEIVTKGINSLKLPANGAILIINAHSNSISTKIIDNLKQANSVKVVANSFDVLPYENNAFDYVIVINTLHDIRPRIKKVKALQEAARVVNQKGHILLFERGLDGGQFRSFLKRAGFTDIQIENNGSRGWWSGPWCPTYTILGQKW